jgi:hypothetical protein
VATRELRGPDLAFKHRERIIFETTPERPPRQLMNYALILSWPAQFVLTPGHGRPLVRLGCRLSGKCHPRGVLFASRGLPWQHSTCRLRQRSRQVKRPPRSKPAVLGPTWLSMGRFFFLFLHLLFGFLLRHRRGPAQVRTLLSGQI